MRKAGNRTLQLFLICFLIVTLIFVVLYEPFIFKGQMYAYEDIGSDTIHQYLPNYTVETDMLRSGEGDGYYLRVGLGKYVSGLLTRYLNPANLAILIFGAEKLHIGLLAATYVKYLMISFFSLHYFLRLLKNEKAAVISTLLWTFSSFNILWGQHYHFLSAMVGFSACMYGFQVYLEEDRKWYLTVPLMALLFGSNYYYSYSSVFFLAGYGVVYLALRKKTVRFILKKAGAFVLVALLTACICASYLTPAVTGFFDSSRTGQVEHAFLRESVVYPVSTLAAFAARFLSTNLIGIANGFKGPANYYEAAILSVSILFSFSVAFLLLGKYRWPTVGITLGCILLLSTPLTSKLLCFDGAVQRWTYLLCFLQTVAIGFALTEFFSHQDDRHWVRHAGIAVLIGDGVLALLGVAMLVYHRHVGGWLNKGSCITLGVILLLYHAAFLLIWRRKQGFRILLGLITLELILCNYATVNHRDTITVEQWYTQMYNDGTQDVVEWIREQDDSIYRINKTYYSVWKTDSLVQGYNGMGYYSSTNSAHLINLAKQWGYDAGNWVGFDGTDWLANDMLGVKYMISYSGANPNAGDVELIYDDGTYSVYKNLDWAGFGYLCQKEMTEDSWSGFSRDQQALLSSEYYYRTGNSATSAAETFAVKEIDLLPYLSDAYDCQLAASETGLVISGTGVDSQLYFSVPEMEGWSLTEIQVEMDVQTPSVAQLFAATREAGYSEERSSMVSYGSGRISCELTNPVDQPVTLRFDPTVAENQTIVVRALRLMLADSEQLNALNALKKQQWNAVTDLVQNHNTFTGTITNPSHQDAMLCMPLIYSDYWKAKVNGESMETVNINGGLVGIMIPPGTHAFELSYDDTVYKVSKWVSWCGIALYTALTVWQIIDSKRKDDRKRV